MTKKIEPAIIPVAPVHGAHSHTAHQRVLAKFEELRRVAEEHGGNVVESLTIEEIDLVILALLVDYW